MFSVGGLEYRRWVMGPGGWGAGVVALRFTCPLDCVRRDDIVYMITRNYRVKE